MSVADQVQLVQERLPEIKVQGQVDKLAQLRQQGLSALAGVSAAIILLVGYLVKRDLVDKAPPPPLPPTPIFDSYQIMQNDKKQTIRLNKMDGSIAVVEDGVIVSRTIDDVFVDCLEPKTYTWERLNDGSKVTVKLEYHDGIAYCSIKVENISPALQQRFSQVKGRDELYRVRFSTSAGTVVLETAFLDTETIFLARSRWFTTNSKDGSSNLENISRMYCTASKFESIRTANIWLY